jgi:uncharacterized protein YlxW (UPF0749 family)
MTAGSDPRPASEEATPRRGHAGGRSWRPAALVAFGLTGILFVLSAINSDGNDLRPGRYTDLASLVSTESDQLAKLKAQVATLNDEVAQLTDSVNDKRVTRLQDKAAALRVPAGLEPVTGPGITVTLSDAPEDVINSTTRNLNLLVVHQQDIQAVVNAMWRGGAVAVAVQGQRLVTTTGIKCEGNAVQLDGEPYAQPYVITGVGDQVELLRAIEEDTDLQTYREQAALPDIAVGWNLESHAQITVPGYTGVTTMNYATVVPAAKR